MNIGELKEWFGERRKELHEDFFTFLRFKSIGTDPAFDADTEACAKWLEEYLKGIGLHVEVWETSGQPVVFASHSKAGDDRPTLMIYQHYDVQPVDPLELWHSDPFEPVVKDGEVVARGAQDNKGQCFYTIAAIRALLEKSDDLGVNLKLFIEGEEESGSAGTREVFASKSEELKSDYLLVVDSGIPAKGVPAVTLGMRGIITAEVICQGSKEDLHSGSFGGIAYSPLRALAEALSSLWDEEGRVAIEGFYDEVKEYTSEELEALDTEIDEESVKKEVGLFALGPEPGYKIGESVSIRPTVEINGLSGGYTGEGFKTVIPAVVHAKVSCRLVDAQDPAKIGKALKGHLERHVPEGMRITVDVDGGAPPFSCDQSSMIAKVAAKAYEEVLEKPCKKIMGGGSVPIVRELAEATGAEAVAIGYGLDSDLIHAPNEHFGLDRLEQGFLTIGRILGLMQ